MSMYWYKICLYISELIEQDSKWKRCAKIEDAWVYENFLIYSGTNEVWFSSNYGNDSTFSWDYSIHNNDPLLFQRVSSFIKNPKRYIVDQHNWEVEKTLKNLE